MINVAFILTPIDFGGAERVSLNLLKAYDRKKYNILVILLIRPWEEKTFFAIEIEKLNIKYLTIPVAIRPLENGNDYFRILRCYRILFSIFKKGEFDIIHTNGYFADIIGIPLSKLFRIPHVSTCHGYINNDIKLRLYNFIDIFLLKFSDQIISVSDGIKDILISWGITANKITTIPNAVILPDLTDRQIRDRRTSARKGYNINDEEIVIGYIGRFSEEKGLKFLLQAVITLNEQTLPIKIMLIGDGSERENLELISRKYGVAQHIIFTGFQQDVVSLLPALDIFILPSLTEGTPMAVLEAMSYGLPVIASRIGGIPDIITHNIDGILIYPGESKHIVEAILHLIKEPEIRKKLSINAKQKIKNFYGAKSWWNKIDNFYSQLL